MARTQLFISYARRDNKWRLKVVSYLSLFPDLIDVWDDSKIGAGEYWLRKINGAMGQSRIALMLISIHFLNSDFIKKHELPKLFKRHEADGMTLYPLLVGHCPWDQIEWLKDLQIRPGGDTSMSDYNSNKADKFLTQMAREIAAMARAAKTKPAKGGRRKAGSKAARSRVTRRKAVTSARKGRAVGSTKRGKRLVIAGKKRASKRALPK